jgi:hypothetical protein
MFIRARSGEADKNYTKSDACLGRLKYTSGSPAARWLGQMIKFRKMAMPWRSRARERDSVGTPDYPPGIPDMHTIHDPMISVS